MLKATVVQAVALQLADGGEAVLVQDGPQWNGLSKFRCIAPPKHDGQTIIAAKDADESPMAAAFGASFNLGDKERWTVMMASPDLASRLQW